VDSRGGAGDSGQPLFVGGICAMSREDRLTRSTTWAAGGLSSSRATALKLAQTLDADSIVVGSYVTDGSGLSPRRRLWTCLTCV